MKIVYFLSISFLFWNSCSKDEEQTYPDIPVSIFEAGDQANGWLTAKKNDLEFHASPFGEKMWNTNDHFYIYFNTYSQGGFLREQLFFDKIPFEVKKMSIKGPPSFNYNGHVGTGYFGVTDDGHVHETTYDLDESANNTFEITYIDTVEQIIRGKFDVTYKIDEKYMPTVDPYKLRFSGAEFEVKLDN